MHRLGGFVPFLFVRRGDLSPVIPPPENAILTDPDDYFMMTDDGKYLIADVAPTLFLAADPTDDLLLTDNDDYIISDT
jgi:hypothetical protein